MNEIEKFAAQEAHEREIVQSRKNGFGGSDACLFLKIARNGLDNLSNTDIERIAVAMGLAEYKPTPGNVYTNAGHKFEDYMADSFRDHNDAFGGATFEREKLLVSQRTDLPFRIFAHADFVANGDTVYELKYKTTKTTAEVLEEKEVIAQCQWYYMLGMKYVVLIHGMGDVEPFVVRDINMVEVKRDDAMIEELERGIMTLANSITDGWQPVTRDDMEVPAEVLTDFGCYFEARARWTELEAQVKAMKKAAEEYEKSIAAALAENNAKSFYGMVNGETHKATIVERAGTTKVNTDKLLADHPELNTEAYVKQTKSTTYVKFS